MESQHLAGVSLKLPKVAQALLDEFGRAVKHARSLRGWQLSDVSNRIAEMDRTKAGQKVTAPAITFLSDIEKGKRAISPPTVGKLIHALDLPESWLTRFLTDAPDEADEETPKDREAERLIRRAEADPDAPETPEALLLLLAEQWAGQRFTDPSLAYNALKSALQTAAEMRAQGVLPSNLSGQFQSILRRVAELNDAGQMDEADAALQDASERHQAEGEALFEAQLKQDRLRNRPADAARRQVERLSVTWPLAGQFWATLELIKEWRMRGDKNGDLFEVAVALEMAKIIQIKASESQIGKAKIALANCYFALGTRQNDRTLLYDAISAHTLALNLSSREQDPFLWANAQLGIGMATVAVARHEEDKSILNTAISAFENALSVYTKDGSPLAWARTQNSLGVAYTLLAEQTFDIQIIKAAILAYSEALDAFTQTSSPMDWAMTKNNIGSAFRQWGTMANDPAQYDAAEAAYADCLNHYSQENSKFYWALAQLNLARLTLCRHQGHPSPGLASKAQAHLDAAREVFSDVENHHQLNMCDRVQTEIVAAKS